MDMEKLPDGWEVKTLGDVCNFVRGPFGGSLKKAYFKPTGYAVYEQQHAINNQFNSIRYYVDNKKFDEMKRFELLAGDLIMSCSGTMGKIAIVPEGIKRGIINQALLKLTVQENLLVKFLKYWMDSPNFQNQLKQDSTGVAIKNVASVKVLKQINLYLPPLPEQKRIVSLLDKAFAQLDQAVVHAEKNLINARELFDSYLDGVFSQKGEGWEEKKLGNISQINYGYTAKASFENKGKKFLRITDIKKDGINWNKVPTCEISPTDFDKYKLIPNDIVFARTGATTGKSYRLFNLPEAVVASYLIRLRLKDKNVLPEFVSYYFNTSEYWNLINKGISGSAQGGFNASKLANLILPVPKISEQKNIINRIDKLQTKTQHLQTLYQQKLTALTELKQSLLQQAFTGQL